MSLCASSMGPCRQVCVDKPAQLSSVKDPVWLVLLTTSEERRATKYFNVYIPLSRAC